MSSMHIIVFSALLAIVTPASAQDPCNPDPRFQHTVLAGEVIAGESFTAEFTDGLSFKLVPASHGWVIEVRDTSGIDRSLITPPIRPFDTNPRNLAGWHFRNADNTGPNQGDVNAPQQRRAFVFESSPPAPDGHEQGRGMLTLDDFGLADLLPQQRARMVYLKFKVCLAWSKAAATTSRVYSGVYRSGFEQSDFYSDDGDGPWWLAAEGENWERIQRLLVMRSGRGSYVAARLKVHGHIEPFDDRGVLVGRRDTRLVVDQILAIEPIPDEEFQARVRTWKTTP